MNSFGSRQHNSARASIEIALDVCLAELEQQTLLITIGKFQGLATKKLFSFLLELFIVELWVKGPSKK